jgi:hypothetical protein
MSIAAVSPTSIYQELQTYFQARNSDLKQLGQALQSGDLAGAQQEFSAIQNLGQGGPFANGNEFQSKQRQQDFNAIGQALQAGDLAGAQQAFAQLKSTIVQHQRNIEPPPSVVVNLSLASTAASAPTAAPSPAPASAPAPSSTGASQPTAASSTGSAPGTEIVLNLGNVTPGEQINIGISNGSNGSEQVTIGVSNQQNQSAEQITLNLNQNTNQQIILNLFNSTPSSAAQGSGVNLTA